MGNCYTKEDIIHALKDVDICTGDTVLLSTSLGMVGILEGCETQDDLSKAFFDAVCDVVGEGGTIIVPTYSYTFSKSTASKPAVFDPQNTPGEIGPFPNYFLRQKGVERTSDPMMSMAGLGPKVASLFKDLPPTSFGEDCLFERLASTDTKSLIIGLPASWLQFEHHLEARNQVPYRYDKLFYGLTKSDNELSETEWLFTVRLLNDASSCANHELGKELLDAGMYKQSRLARAIIYSSSYRECYDYVHEKLKRNKWLIAAGPAGDPFEMEEARVGKQEFYINLSSASTVQDVGEALAPLPRYVLSDGFDAALNALNAVVPMKIHEYPTGSHCLGRVVPEKWTLHEACLRTLSGMCVFSAEENPLHVVSHSLAYEGEVGREELFTHLHTHQLADGIPYKYKYYNRDWGLSCSEEQKAELVDEQYHVSIKADFSYGKLRVGDIFVPGNSEECIVLCADLSTPAQFNNGLSGVLAGLDVMRKLKKRASLKYGYRLLLLPGELGAAAWLSQHAEQFAQAQGVLFLNMLASDAHYNVHSSDVRSALVDQALDFALSKCGEEYEISSEASFQKAVAPFKEAGVDIPIAGLTRSHKCESYDYPSNGYESHLDTLVSANWENLDKSISLVMAAINYIEKG